MTVTRDTMSHVSWATPVIGDGEQTVEDGGDPLHGNLLPWWRVGGGVAATVVPSSSVPADDLQHSAQVSSGPVVFACCYK